MHEQSPSNPTPKSFLDQISTRWSSVNDPFQFVLRYSLAIRNYVGAIIKNQHDADEVTQDFLMRVVRLGFPGARPDRGRFRDYLKTAVRNAALKHLRRQKNTLYDESLLDQVADEDVPTADQAWTADWQRCLLGRVWSALERYQMRHPGNLFHTVLRLSVDHPQEDSEKLAARVSAQSGRSLRADAFRKQVSRARRHFAELLLREIKQTVENPTPENIHEELVELGLLGYVRDFLPPDWLSRG